jgi:hypothetical protein
MLPSLAALHRVSRARPLLVRGLSAGTAPPAGKQAAAAHSNLEAAAKASAAALGNEQVLIEQVLIERLNDKGLLHSAGLIGGEWRGASSGATFQVRRQCVRATL